MSLFLEYPNLGHDFLTLPKTEIKIHIDFQEEFEFTISLTLHFTAGIVDYISHHALPTLMSRTIAQREP